MFKHFFARVKNSIKNNNSDFVSIRYHAFCYALLLLYYRLASYFGLQKFLQLRKFIATPEVANLIATKKIVYILQCNFYSRDSNIYLSGGQERYLNDLSEIIISLGYVPIIIQQGDRFWYKKHHNIHVIGLGCGDNFILFNYLAHHRKFGSSALRIYSPFTLAYPISYSRSIGLSHGIFWDRPYTTALAPILKKSFSNVKRFVSVDTATISWFRSSFPIEVIHKQMQYIPNYVDRKQFLFTQFSTQRVIKILYPRAISFERGYFLLTAVIPKLLKLFNNLEFHIVGIAIEQELQKSVDKLVATYPGKVFAYHMDADSMYKVYQQADIIIIPTILSEGTSLSCLEAMATAKPIIATNVGGLSDLIIDGYNGLLISPDVNSLHDAIIKLIASEKLRKKLADNAFKVAESFDKNIWEIKWVEILRADLIHNS